MKFRLTFFVEEHGIELAVNCPLLNCRVNIRMSGEGPVSTDNGNIIADAHTGPTISNPEKCEAQLLQIAGVVQVGLFNNMCDAVVLASDGGIETIVKPNGRLS